MDEDIQEQGSRRGLVAIIAGTALAAGAAAVGAVAAQRKRLRGTHVEMTIDIDRPVEDVFTFLSDSRNELQWVSAATERRKLTGGPIGLGTRFEAVDGLGRRAFRTTEVIAAFEPDRRILTTVSGTWNGSYEVRFEPVDGRTMLHFEANIRGSGIIGLLDVLPDAVMHRLFERDAERLKDLLDRHQEQLFESGEAGDSEPTAISVEAETEVHA